MTEQEEMHLCPSVNRANRYNSSLDFKFVIIEKYLSIENEFALKDGLLLQSYFFLKRFALSDKNAFGIDKSSIITEDVPLFIRRRRI